MSARSVFPYSASIFSSDGEHGRTGSNSISIFLLAWGWAYVRHIHVPYRHYWLAHSNGRRTHTCVVTDNGDVRAMEGQTVVGANRQLKRRMALSCLSAPHGDMSISLGDKHLDL